MQNESLVLDPGLAPDGHRKIDWAARHSPVLNRVRDEYLKDGTFEGLGVGVALPIEAKTAYLTVVLAEAGAEVAVASPGPFFVQDDVAAALAERGVTVYASSQNPPEESDRELERVLDQALDGRSAVLIDERGGEVQSNGKGGGVGNPLHRRQRCPVQVSLRQPLRHWPVDPNGDHAEHEPDGGRKARRRPG